MKWNFVPFKTKLFPLVEDYVKLTTTQSMNYKGQLSQCTVKNHRHEGESRELEIVVSNYKSEDVRPKAAVAERSLFSFGAILEESPESTELYRISFSAAARAEKESVLNGKISAEQKKVNLGAGSQDALVRL